MITHRTRLNWLQGPLQPAVWVLTIVALLVAMLPASLTSALRPGIMAPQNLPAAAAPLPLSFLRNAGQAGPAVRFLVQAGAYALAFRADGVDVRFAGSPQGEADLRLRFVAAEPAPVVEGLDAGQGVVSYLRGDDPAAWQTGLPTYAGLAYRSVYPGVDLVYRSAGGVLKGEFVVAAGAGDRAAVLQALITEAAVALQASPRDLKLYRALYHTYFQPAATQEQAAELLDLPFSTYRRHLTAGIAQVTEALRGREVGGA